MRFQSRLLAALLVPCPVSSLAGARELTFEERVDAQEAIDRFYYAHQTGAQDPFDAAVPRSAIEAKVLLGLRESRLLETFWHTPVTSQALARELERIAEQTQMPDRLREIYRALGNDPVLVQEALVRPVLVRRLTRSFCSMDERIHAPDDRGLSPEVAARVGTDSVAVRTGTLLVHWSGYDLSTILSTGGRYDPVLDVWLPMNAAGAPTPRINGRTVWTGREMLVWGGAATSNATMSSATAALTIRGLTPGDRLSLTAMDGAGNLAQSTVDFTIDLVPPVVTVYPPSRGLFAVPFPTTLRFADAFSDGDDDGAAGDVVREKVYWDGCLVFDGNEYGNGDGILTDESLPARTSALCRVQELCGTSRWSFPRIRVEALGCAGNLAFRETTIPAVIALTPGDCPRSVPISGPRHRRQTPVGSITVNPRPRPD